MIFASLGTAGFAERVDSRVVLGADLNEEQINSVYNMFSISRGNSAELTITNAEEREYLEGYVDSVMRFTKEAAARGVVVVLRLWNQGGYDSTNERLVELVAQHLPRPWSERYYGWRLADNVYLEYDRMFEWPDSNGREYASEEAFCYALRNQIGVLCDGTVVPCCLDHNGDIPLGNLFEQSLDEILSSPRAKAMYDGFTRHEAVEPLCRRCGYMAVTKRFRK